MPRNASQIRWFVGVVGFFKAAALPTCAPGQLTGQARHTPNPATGHRLDRQLKLGHSLPVALVGPLSRTSPVAPLAGEAKNPAATRQHGIQAGSRSLDGGNALNGVPMGQPS